MIYKVKITYFNNESSVEEFDTSDIQWSMEEFQRNRKPFQWEIL
jgi:hypothetical protein